MNTMITLGIPQILICLIFFVGLLQSGIKHGEPKDDKYNFWGTLIGIIINVAILTWGGFF